MKTNDYPLSQKAVIFAVTVFLGRWNKLRLQELGEKLEILKGTRSLPKI